MMSQYLIDLALAEGDGYLGYLPSIIAAAAVAVARMNLDLSLWTVKLQKVTGYDIEQLRSLIISLSRTHTNEFETHESIVYLRYCSREYMHMAKIWPLHISDVLLDQAVHFPDVFTTEDDSVPLRVLLSKLGVDTTHL